MQTFQTVPEAISSLYKQYAGIPVPYFISKHAKILRRRLYKGKGSIQEIQSALALLQTKKTQKVSNKELLEEQGIGIDCSGFVSQLYDTYCLHTYQKHVWEYYTRKTYNPINLILFRLQPIVSMLNADTLSSKGNCKEIKQIADIQPMDLIRLSGGKHIVLVYKVIAEDGIVKKVEYVHSTTGVGVCKGIITVTDVTKPITAQQWEPLEANPTNQPANLIRYHVNDNGIRRPYFLTKQ